MVMQTLHKKIREELLENGIESGKKDFIPLPARDMEF